MLNGVDLSARCGRCSSAQGVQIFEGTLVTRVREGATVELSTPGGTVRAKAIVLATSGYTPRLGYFRTGLLPVISHVIATDPLPRRPLARRLRRPSPASSTTFRASPTAASTPRAG